MTDPQALTALADQLTARQADIAATRVVAGLDGFVDELIQVVDERQDLEHYTPIASLARFGELLTDAAGKSSLREIVVTSTDAGGCAVNLGDGIAHLGVQLDYFGTLGQPRHAAFDAFASRCRSCTGWGREPGRTLALEFADGKYMLSSVAQLAEFDCALLDQVLADGAFAEACGAAHLIALTNWTLYPHMTACWKKLQDRVFAELDQRPWFFIDLVDPRSRSREDLEAMVQVLRRFEIHGRTVFGGNLNEANAMAALLGIDQVDEDAAAMQEQTAAIRASLEIEQVAIHAIRGAACATAAGTAWVDGPYTATPKKSTGAGDRFNAGYCLGNLLDLPAKERLLLGTAASGYFVRNAHSATGDQLIAFCRQWAADELPD